MDLAHFDLALCGFGAIIGFGWRWASSDAKHTRADLGRNKGRNTNSLLYHFWIHVMSAKSEDR